MRTQLCCLSKTGPYHKSQNELKTFSKIFREKYEVEIVSKTTSCNDSIPFDVLNCKTVVSYKRSSFEQPALPDVTGFFYAEIAQGGLEAAGESCSEHLLGENLGLWVQGAARDRVAGENNWLSKRSMTLCQVKWGP